MIKIKKSTPSNEIIKLLESEKLKKVELTDMEL